MALINIRKKLLNIETVYHEGGPVAAKPLTIGTIAIVFENPYAGRYVEDLSGLVAEAGPVASQMVEELLAALGGKEKIETYGKGAIIGLNGEMEHGAIWHQAGGGALRAALTHAKAIVPAAKAVATAGHRLHIPLHNILAAYVRSHFNSAEISVSDAPRPNELLYALAMSTGPRIHERLGGLRVDQISVHDGQR